MLNTFSNSLAKSLRPVDNLSKYSINGSPKATDALSPNPNSILGLLTIYFKRLSKFKVPSDDSAIDLLPNNIVESYLELSKTLPEFNIN